jgi:Ca2+/Na+ antiporter
MDLGTLGANLTLIAGIIGLTAVVKKLDTANRLKRVYILIPLALGIVAGILTTKPLEWRGVGINAIIYAGISSYIYQTGKKLVVGGVTIDPGAETAQGSIAQAPDASAGGEASEVPKAVRPEGNP